MEGFVIGNEAERQFYLAAAGIRDKCDAVMARKDSSKM